MLQAAAQQRDLLRHEKKFTRHRLSVRACVFTACGKHFFTASSDRTIGVNSAYVYELTNTLRGHDKGIYSLAYHPTGKYIASGSSDQTVRIWSVENASCVKVLQHSGSIYACDFSPDGKWLVTGTTDNKLTIWDVENISAPIIVGEMQGHKDVIYDCKYDSRSRFILSASKDGTLKLWDPRTMQFIRSINRGKKEIFSCDFSKNLRQIVFGLSDGTIEIIDAANFQSLKTLQGHQDTVSTVIFTDDSKHIISSSFDKKIKIWQVDSGECISTSTEHQAMIRSCAYTNNYFDGPRVVSCDESGVVNLWRLPDSLSTDQSSSTSLFSGVVPLFLPNRGDPGMGAAAARSVSSITPSAPPAVEPADTNIEPPSEFMCSISGDVMKAPVMLNDGHTFEKATIERWFGQGKNTCPLCNRVVDKRLLPNISLKNLIQDWLRKHDSNRQRFPDSHV